MDKKDKSWIEKFFGERSFGDFNGLGGGGGYSIRVTQTPEGTVVKARLSDNMECKKVKKKLKRKYPDAKIKIKGGKKEGAKFKIKKRRKLSSNSKKQKADKKSHAPKNEKSGDDEKVSLQWEDGELRVKDKE